MDVACCKFKRQPYKIVKYTQTIRQLLLKNCLSASDHFVGLALKGLKSYSETITPSSDARYMLFDSCQPITG